MVTAAADGAVDASANSKSNFSQAFFTSFATSLDGSIIHALQLIISLKRRQKRKGMEVLLLIPTCNNKPSAMTTWSDMNNSGRKVLRVFFSSFFSEHQQRNESGRVSKLGKIGKLLRGPKEENKSSSSESSPRSATQRYHYYVRLIIPKHLSSADDHPFFFVSFWKFEFFSRFLSQWTFISQPPARPARGSMANTGKGAANKITKE